MILVVDASFAAKVLLREDGSTLARSWWQDEAATWIAPALIAAEVEAAVHVHHRNHPTRFPTSRRTDASRQWATIVDDIALHAVDRQLVTRAIDLVGAHGPLRGADACYLAVAAELLDAAPDEVVLASFDAQQRRAAGSIGLPLAPPNPAS